MIALLIRDLRLATRTGGGFGLGLAFFLIVTILVPFGVGAEISTLSRIAPGILWVGALLSCLLSLDRVFALDFEDGSLDLLATSPVPMEGVVVVKALAHWLVTGVPLTLVAPVLGLLLNLPVSAYGWLVLTLLIATVPRVKPVKNSRGVPASSPSAPRRMVSAPNIKVGT